MKLSDPEGDRRGEEIVAALTTEGLEDMSAHFLPRRHSWCWDGRAWSMVREGGGGEFPYGLHPMDGSPSLLECVRPVPQA